MRDEHTPGKPVDEAVSELKFKNVNEVLSARIASLNDYIKDLRADGYSVELSIREDVKLIDALVERPNTNG